MKKYRMLIGIIISIAFLVAVFRNVNYKQILETFLHINYAIILPAIVIQMCSYWVRSIRWSLMLSSIKKTKITRLFSIICISYMANSILPLRAGDLARAYLIGEKEGISKTAAFSTVILEKIYDGIALLLFLGVIALVFPFPMWLKTIGIITTLIFAGALLFTIFLVTFRNKTMDFTKFFLKFVPEKVRVKVLEILEKLIDGFDIVKDKKNLLPIALCSIIVWLMEAYLLYAIAVSFGFTSTVYLAIFTLVVINLGIMVPSSPGNVGTFEYFCIKALSLFNVTKDIALGFALVYRVLQYTPITLLGFIFLLKEGVSLSSMTSLSSKKQ